MTPKKELMGSKRQYVTLYIDNDVLEKIDKKRGLIPRNAYFNAIIRKFLKGDFEIDNES